MVLHRRGVNCKAGPQWVPGVWLGKSEQEDLHIVAFVEKQSEGPQDPGEEFGFSWWTRSRINLLVGSQI